MYIFSCNLSIYMYTGWIRWWSSQNSIMRMCFERLLLSSCCCSSSLWVSHGYLAIFLVHLIQWWTQIRLKQHVFVYCYSYKNDSKTDIKCSWLKHPKSRFTGISFILTIELCWLKFNKSLQEIQSSFTLMLINHFKSCRALTSLSFMSSICCIPNFI